MPRTFHHPTIEQITLGNLLHALSDPIRRQIVAHLIESPSLSCSKTCKVLAPSTLSFHYRVLREAGLVQSEKTGTEVHNTLRLKELNKRFPRLLRTIIQYHEPIKITEIKVK